MTPIDRAALRALAEMPSHMYVLYHNDPGDGCHFCHLPPLEHDSSRVLFSTVLALLDALDAAEAREAALREAAENVSDTLHDYNIDFSGLASQYEAVYRIGKAIQRLRAALAAPDAEGE